jgi:formylglycine-generating enzyme required for sulfatase activity
MSGERVRPTTDEDTMRNPPTTRPARRRGRSRAGPARGTTDEMAWVPGGSFVMGSDRHYPEEAPAREVAVEGFWIDRHPVTNEQFGRFVAETGHVTVAEQAPDPDAYPDARPDLLVPASAVFRTPRPPVDLRDIYRWWIIVPGANWRHPRGPQSSLRGIEHHPVVHVAWADVEAYARWAGKDLATEAEWERACRGDQPPGGDFAWGDELSPGGRHMANVWQGEFPVENLVLDGYERTSPVGAFPPNGYGLYDMIGNVWEWTADSYHAPGDDAHDHGDAAPGCCSADAGTTIERRVIKGGSHLCAPNYCQRYRPAARMAQPVDTSTSHVGFRCVRRPPSSPTEAPDV